MHTKITEEDIDKEYNGGDQDTCVLDLEILLYFQLNDNFKVKRINKNVILTNDKNNKEIYLRGDNLITKKTMYRRIFFPSFKEYLNSKIENDNHIYSYILMPHIKSAAKCQLNSKRASVGEYSDNPFVFFNSLKSLYNSNFEKKTVDKVEEWIIKNKEFWELFGNENEGYKNYLRTFCLEEIEELMEFCDCNYKKFFEKRIIPEEWGQKEWTEYVEILYCFRDKRKKCLMERVSQISNL